MPRSMTSDAQNSVKKWPKLDLGKFMKNECPKNLFRDKLSEIHEN